MMITAPRAGLRSTVALGLLLLAVSWLAVVTMPNGAEAKPDADEADCSAIAVSALEEGVIKLLCVATDDEVAPGQVIAELVPDDAVLQLRRCRGQVATREAELKHAIARREAAKSDYENLTERHLEVAAIASELAEAQVALSQLPALIDVAKADAKLASKDAEKKSENAEALAPIVVLKAETSAKQSESKLGELQERRRRLQEQIDALKVKQEVIVRRRDLKTDETLALASAEAGVETAEAQLEIAKADLADAQLSMERLTIRAPAAGRVAKICALPGQHLLKSVDTMQIIRLETKSRKTKSGLAEPTM